MAVTCRAELVATVRVLDVTVAVSVPYGHVPSAKTLTEDLRARLRPCLTGTHQEDALRAFVGRVVDRYFLAWTIGGERAVRIVRERSGDRLVGVHVDITIGG